MEYKQKKLLKLKEIDTYTDAVWATVVFAHECSWNPDTKKIDNAVKFGVGRSMTRPDKKVVTPDLVIQDSTTTGAG
jgi:hypothetical protein